MAVDTISSNGGAEEEILGIIAGMDADQQRAALIEAVVKLTKRVEVLEAAIQGASGALRYPSAT